MGLLPAAKLTMFSSWVGYPSHPPPHLSPVSPLKHAGTNGSTILQSLPKCQPHRYAPGRVEFSSAQTQCRSFDVLACMCCFRLPQVCSIRTPHGPSTGTIHCSTFPFLSTSHWHDSSRAMRADKLHVHACFALLCVLHCSVPHYIWRLQTRKCE